MRIHQEKLEIRTNGKGLYEITDELRAKVDKCGVRNGIVTALVQHTSCSVVIMENADPTARRQQRVRIGQNRQRAGRTVVLDESDAAHVRGEGV